LLNLDRLDSLMKENGWKAPYICAKLGSSRYRVADWRRDKNLPTDNEIAVLADLFNVSVEYLCGETDEKAQKNKPITSKEDDELIDLFGQIPTDKKQEAVNYLRYLIEHREK